MPPGPPSAPLPRFEHTDHAGIAAFFGRTGYVCVAGALSAAEVAVATGGKVVKMC
jgi:hypothetical protein